MGCCVSHEPADGGVSPQQNTSIAHANSSTRHITAPSAAATPRSSHAHPHQSTAPRTVAPNTSLRAIAPGARSKLPAKLPGQRERWTRTRLAKERKEFWETRTSGSPEVWQTLRAICDNLQEGTTDEAQTFFDAAGCTCPTGDIWRGVYDAMGVSYKIEDWVVIDPEGLVEDEDEESDGAIKVDKGKQKAEDGAEDMPLRIDVKVRISTSAKDYMLPMFPTDAVAVLEDMVQQLDEVRPVIDADDRPLYTA
ncbi:hypothetical protein EJ04DRAFT_511744 [Polyplosphaeria fusca]|uniref:DC-UbP/UBTD2 N-terminal domain-containing protein n=1 Tax=Polyplosphaeria fusca TaxID=682080 RepID=A0A9P4V3T9_9PLEO|nr:hypothetical protein EJ04DRAFT_511744 [Polyplosphaeria fusca]